MSGLWAVPESYSCWRFKCRLKAAAASLPPGKKTSTAQFFHGTGVHDRVPYYHAYHTKLTTKE